jgi:hypothetical protein
MVDLDEPRFSMKQVAQATPGNMNTIFTWFQRGHFALGERDRPAEIGLSHSISLRTALEVAIAVELHQRCTLHPAIGAGVARQFTQLGDEERGPGELYPKDFTVLVVFPESRDGRVIRVGKTTPMLDAFHSPYGGRQNAVILLWLNHIDRNVRTALLQSKEGG